MTEHEKLMKVRDDSQIIGEFLDWLMNEKGYVIAHCIKDNWQDDRLAPCGKSIEKILALYFNIDLQLLEKEKLELLNSIRSGDHVNE